jgi:histidine triad (HIT) family protein
MTECVFCKIAAGEIPCHKVYEDDHHIVFMDMGQVNPGHVIVSLKPHFETILDLDEDQTAAIFKLVNRVAKAVQQEFNPDGLTLLQANRKAGFQTIPHFHVHLLPRHREDGVALTWPVKNPPAEELAKLAARIEVV